MKNLNRIDVEFYNKLQTYANQIIGSSGIMDPEDLVHDYLSSSNFANVDFKNYTSQLGYIYRGMEMLARRERRKQNQLPTETADVLDVTEDRFFGFEAVEVEKVLTKYSHMFSNMTRQILEIYMSNPPVGAFKEICQEKGLNYSSFRELTRRKVRKIIPRLLSIEFNDEVLAAIKKYNLVPVPGYPAYFINRDHRVFCLFQDSMPNMNEISYDTSNMTSYPYVRVKDKFGPKRVTTHYLYQKAFENVG